MALAVSHQEAGKSIQFLLADLKECSKTRNLERGKQVHKEAIKCDHDSNLYVVSALVNMYAKCGSMVDARHVFDSVEHPDTISWNALLLGYAESGEGLTALDLFVKMKTGDHVPDSATFVAVLKACTYIGEYRVRGQAIHNLVLYNGCYSDIYVQNTLIDMYAKCGNMLHACWVFDGIKHPDVIAWNILMLGYTDNGEGFNALTLFRKMKTRGPAPDSVTFVAALKACASLTGWPQCKDWGKATHNLTLECACYLNSYVQSILIDMYSKCGSMIDAHQVFESVKHPNVVCWNALILGYADNGEGLTCLEVFKRMRIEGPAPNSVTFAGVLKTCVSVEEGAPSRWACGVLIKAVHNIVVDNVCNSDIFVQSILIDMYSQCGIMISAREVFDSIKHPDVVCWNALILGYAECGEGFTSLDLFTRMTREGPEPDSFTFIAILKVCTSECRDRCKAIHNLSVGNSNIYVQNMLTDIYAKSGSIVDAHLVFDSMKHPDIVSWNTLILGYVETGQGGTALDLFMKMKSQGIAPNCITFSGSLKACALVGALEFGRIIHSEINCINVDLVNCLVDFYAKCGSMVEAQSVFDLFPETRDTITWNSLLHGFSSCGDNAMVFRLFKEMQDSGFQPDSVTFLCILISCSYSGLVKKGKDCFEAMPRKYGIIPNVDHYTCMVDIFGRANKLDQAMALLGRMPCNPDNATWMTILAACSKWKNVEIGRLAFQSLVHTDRETAGYRLMQQIYAVK